MPFTQTIRSKPIRRMALAVALTAICGYAWGSGLTLGEPAPALTMTALDGTHFDTRELQGKVVFVTFWATWCEPCRTELPALSRYADEHSAQGFSVLALSLDPAQDLERVRAVARELHFPVGLLADPHVPGYGRIWRLPVSFVIDRQGRLSDNGWNDKEPAWTAARLEREITPLLLHGADSSAPH
jgi:cytochrome c biogenesis protein CcmG/thiol:disulfide interchange protein DsbE